MPTYQYACTHCGHRHEAVQSFSDAQLTICPECGGPLRKVFSSVGVVFKGSGFYRNDSRAAKESADATSSSGSKDPAGAKKSADAKPAAASGSSGESKGGKTSSNGQSAPSTPASTPAKSGTSSS